MNNRIHRILIQLGLSTEDSVFEFHPYVRDRKDVKVLKCRSSGVLFLSSTNHIDIADYVQKPGFKYWGSEDRRAAINSCQEDTRRRFNEYARLAANRRWMDVGTGAGAILDLMSPLASQTVAVEPQEQARVTLRDLGYEVYSKIEDVCQQNFDLVTLFHVFEHLTDPIETLNAIKNTMAPGAKLIVEVPHANDLLISFFDNESFKSFTFWSEHLILHTRESLRRFLSAGGFENIVIRGLQRYPLANHLHWLDNKGPGGHFAWDFLRTPDLDRSYAELLSQIDRTDTLVATCQKPI